MSFHVRCIDLITTFSILCGKLIVSIYWCDQNKLSNTTNQFSVGSASVLMVSPYSHTSRCVQWHFGADKYRLRFSFYLTILLALINIFLNDSPSISKNKFMFFVFFLFFFSLQFDNVNNCLNTLHTLSVGGLDGITTNDICSGRLRAILDLFYALSVYKQASKQKLGGSIKQSPKRTADKVEEADGGSSISCNNQGQQPLSQSTQLGNQPTAVNASNEMLNR